MQDKQSFTAAIVELCQQRKETELLQTIAEAYRELSYNAFIEWFDDDVTTAVNNEEDYNWLEVVVYSAEIAQQRSELWSGFKNVVEDAWRVIEMERLRLFSRDRLIERIESGEFDRSRTPSPGQLSIL